MNFSDTRCALRDAAVHAPGLRRIAGFAELARSAALRARPGATRIDALSLPT